MTSPDNLLSRLDKVRQLGPEKWQACCPAHADRSPSLSIRESDGKILLYCFTGCSAEEVLDSLGMSFGDLYPDPSKAAYCAATASGGAKFRKRFERDHKLELRGEDLQVLRIAKQWLSDGKQLTLEDRARLDLALERLNGEAAA